MFKPSLTVHKSPTGEIKTLSCSEDAAVPLKAYYGCEEPGELVYIRKGHVDKIKKIKEIDAVPAKKKTSKAKEN